MDLERVSTGALVLAAYFIAGRIGLAVPFTSGNVSPVWPPAGIALAATLLLGYRVWPAIAIGAFLVNFLTPIPVFAAFGIAAGNTAGALLGAWLLRRIPGFRTPLVRLGDVLGLAVVAALGGSVSATIGTAALSLTQVDPWSSAGRAWLIWWLGDAMGVLVVAPLVLTVSGLRTRPDRVRLLEFGVLLTAAALCSAVVFGRQPGFGAGHYVFSLALFPFVMWGAMRFDTVGSAAVTGVIASTAVWNTAHGRGLFVDGTALQNATLLQSFLSVIALSGLSVAALVAERTRLVGEEAGREARRRADERYREICETANEGVWVIDSRLLTCFVNRRMVQMLGYSAEEMLGKPVFSFMFDEDAARKMEELERRMRGVNEQTENRLRRKDGTELWVKVSTSGSSDAAGRFVGALAMVSDITELKRHEVEDKRSRREILLLSRAVEQTADSVIVTDKSGIIEYVNPAFEATTGFEREEAIGRTPAILKSGYHDRSFYRDMWDQLSCGEPFRGTLVNRKKSGSLYWAEQTITPIRDGDGDITHFVSVLKDVTGLRWKQEQEIELRLAREVQQRFCQAPMALPGLDLGAASSPMKETGGDYFDFFLASDDVVCVAVGDASGHGLGSALVMALTRAYVRSFASMGLDVGEVLTRINRLLTSDLEENRFVTLLLARIDLRRSVLSYASAGHVPGYVVGEGNRMDAMPSTGPPMGVIPESTFPTCELQLELHDVLVLVTDGVTESGVQRGEEFGVGRLIAHVKAHTDRSASEIADGLCQAARRFGEPEPQADDITTVVVRVLSCRTLPAAHGSIPAQPC